MGITARGAWVSVQRHFLEMGVDVQKDPVQVVGCGDMSGDVFGNGMLLSKAIKLVAAFDHRHIFIDPYPDPAKSWKERKRLFALPRSSWEDYDAKLISRGGGVFSRSAKSITLSKAAMAMLGPGLGLESSTIEPDALISAILKSDSDLIWFGGIGTYIKAKAENHAAVGDPGNDAIRVDACDLRAKVIGEGANLGTTQAGRIEFALTRKGRINTDFIDNSAGVDCSDNEVNIKIALADARQSGKLSAARRNTLLEEMTENVAELVLANNRLQALALSVAQLNGARGVPSQLHLMATLEAGGQLDRATEGLGDDQALMRRAAEGKGLTRPELAVLLSTTKLVLQDAIEASDLPDDPILSEALFAAFPAEMRSKFKAQITGHRLRREIIATQLANVLINRLGVIHPFELAEEEGVDLAEVAAAFVAAEKLYGLSALWEQLESAKLPEHARLMLLDRLAAAIGNLMSDILRTSAGSLAPSTMIDDLGKGVSTLSKAAEQLLSDGSRQQSNALKKSLIDEGASEKLASEITHMFNLDGTVGLAQLAKETGIEPVSLTRGFSAIGTHLGLDWAQTTAAMMSPSDVWERLLVDGLARDFQQMRLELLRRLAPARKANTKNNSKDTITDGVEQWIANNASAVGQFRTMIERAKDATPIAPAMLAQIASSARNLLAR
jgi:glutamate dehydrogenase